MYGRGYTLVAVDANGVVQESECFDTHAYSDDAEELADFINYAISNGEYVIGVVRDEASAHMTEEAYEALASLGCSLADSVGYRDSYVFIARKGHANNIKEKFVKHNEGFAQIEMSAAGRPLAWYWFDPGRAYDPMIGRWMSVDPMALSFPDQSPYQYTHNNPINRFDLDGMADFGSAERLDKIARSIMNDKKYIKKAILKPFDIHEKYLPEYDAYDGDGWETYCNFAARDILLAGGDNSLVGLRAYDINLILNGIGQMNRTYTEVSYADAVSYAKEGITVILSSSDHVAIVAPEMGYSESLHKAVPMVYNVGNNNGYIPASKAFEVKNMPKAFVSKKDLKSLSERKNSSKNSLLQSVATKLWGSHISPQEMWDSTH